MSVRNSLANDTGAIGDMRGKGYVDMTKKGERDMYTDRLPGIS